ncbi:hypothetical protein [Jannaschia seohaensis]|uniref:hypothetical protein n=1 Tax=Jannaschia seohaensis TaxID=475081 RepID=UPI0011B25387|nr:hypothetical protein [Jannaschia seohaensis]
MGTTGVARSETVTATTVCIRTHQATDVDGMPPSADLRVHRALAMSNEDDLELGLVRVAGTHHVCRIHPEHAEVPPPETDPAQGPCPAGRNWVRS